MIKKVENLDVTKGSTTQWGKGLNTIRGHLLKEINLFPVNTANKLGTVGLSIRTIFATVILHPFPLLWQWVLDFALENYLSIHIPLVGLPVNALTLY